MPHCTIEFSASLAEQVSDVQLLNAVFEGASASQLFDVKAIKCRAISYQAYLSKAPESNFIHVTIKIMSGRNSKQKQLLASSVLQKLTSLQLADLSMTVDVADLDAQCYAKAVA